MYYSGVTVDDEQQPFMYAMMILTVDSCFKCYFGKPISIKRLTGNIDTGIMT